MAGNTVYVQGSYIDVHDNEVVNLNVDKADIRLSDNTQTRMAAAERDYDASMLIERVKEVRSMFWADSAMAVIFCVCRDCYHYANNMSQFERDFHCKEGLLSNTFSDNPYMRKNINDWKKNGAKERVLKLVEAFKKAVERVQEE